MTRLRALRLGVALLFVVFGALLASNPPPAHAANIDVDSTADAVAVDGGCTLREAIIAANTDAAVNECAGGAGADTITLPAGTYTLMIVGDDDTAAVGDLDITAGSDITIMGAGASTTIIQACTVPQIGASCTADGVGTRVMHVVAGGTLSLDGVTVRHGRTAVGAAVYVEATAALTVANSVIAYNDGGNGGGIASSGTTTVSGTTLTGNEGDRGGAFWVGNGGALSLSGSVVSDNVGDEGGIIYAATAADSVTIDVTSSLFSGNANRTASFGHVELNANADADIWNSTFTANGAGAVIHQDEPGATAVLMNVTIANSMGRGVVGTNGTLALINTIVSGSTAADCEDGGGVGIVRSLIEDGSCGATLSGDPMLGALASNGGPTQTHALLAGSPAINAASNIACANAPVNGLDQRGVTRSGPCDIGAYEYNPSALAFTVDSTTDAVDDTTNGVCASPGGECTLRAAIQEANAWRVPTTITLPAGAYTLDLDGAGEDLGATGDLDVMNGGNVTIVGAGASASIIEACQTDQLAAACGAPVGVEDRVFHVVAGSRLTLQDVTVRHGREANDGGGIYNASILVVTDSVVAANRAGNEGGGIYSGGTATVTRSTVSGNEAHGGNAGAGVFNASGANFTLSRSTVSGNTSTEVLGGIVNVSGTLTVVNSTISGNTGDVHGGITSAGAGSALTLLNSTVTGNVGGAGGSGGLNTLAANVANTIIAGNTGGDGDCSAVALTDDGHNIIGDGSCAAHFTNVSTMVNTDPMLGALASNGGATQTHALLDGSPGIDAGDDAVCGDAPVGNVDQRGTTRATGAACDIGAYEAPAPPPPPAPATPSQSPLNVWSALLGVQGGSLGGSAMSMQFPSGALPGQTMLSLLWGAGLNLPVLPSSNLMVISPLMSFLLQAESAGGEALTSFGLPAGLSMALGMPGTQEQDPLLAWHNGSMWMLLPSLFEQIAGMVTGDIPGPGAFSLLAGTPFSQPVAPQGLSLQSLDGVGAPVDLMSELLQGQGCASPTSLWQAVEGLLQGYIFGAPPHVNAMFPDTLFPEAPFMVRCAAPEVPPGFPFP